MTDGVFVFVCVRVCSAGEVGVCFVLLFPLEPYLVYMYARIFFYENGISQSVEIKYI